MCLCQCQELARIGNSPPELVGVNSSLQPLLETICHCFIKLKVQIPHQVHTPGKPCVEEDSPPRCPQSTVCSSETSGQPRHS